jgi:hypothetical protein
MISFDNTLSVITEAARGVPEIPRGHQTQKFKIGQTVFASGVGSLKRGTKITITDCYEQHGYWYYVGENDQVHREKDLMV